MTILTLAGSPSLHSRSSALLHYASRRLARHGLGVEEMGIRDLPAVDLIEGHYNDTAAIVLRKRVQAAQALLISTPVYKASFAGGLKAVLDLLDEKSLADKIVLPIATGGSAAHLLALEYSLKPVLSALGARHILAGVYATDRQVTVQEQGNVSIVDDVRERLDNAVDRLIKHVTTVPLSQGYDLGHLALNARFSV
jgi:FMN reductase